MKPGSTVQQGLSNDEIPARLVVTMHTVKADIGALRSRFHASDRAQLVIAVYEDGIAEGSAPDAGGWPTAASTR